ncbi:MAG TPA: STAS domain-containing protein [Kamptonema sp.]|nr:STAS domain-containing protein [Kamptonema sp.]
MHALAPRELITVIQPQGYLNAATVRDFNSQASAAFGNPSLSALLVDMGKVEFLDSAGLLAIVSCLKTAKNLNKRFSICSVSSAIRMIFELSQLDRVFEIFDNATDFETAIANSNNLGLTT